MSPDPNPLSPHPSKMSAPISNQLSLFRSELQNRRFNAGTLQILESLLVVRDVRSLTEIRTALCDLLRSAAMPVMSEIADRSVDQKLWTVEFFVRALALVGDVESCLALKYEALILRETKCANDEGLRVSYKEWVTFAKDSLDYGFYTIASKGFESALLCIQANKGAYPELDEIGFKENTVHNIKQLRDKASALVASHSVQTQCAEYSKRKASREVYKNSSCPSNEHHVASLTFRSGIRGRNMQKLIQSQGLCRDFLGP